MLLPFPFPLHTHSLSLSPSLNRLSPQLPPPLSAQPKAAPRLSRRAGKASAAGGKRAYLRRRVALEVLELAVDALEGHGCVVQERG